eukprot:COSAG02_NODE_37350_length_443_cov_0.630814_1_plen_82_part_00
MHRAVEAMKSKDVQSAGEQIQSAMELEATVSLDSSEYHALSLMHKVCEHWQKGNDALEEWDGVNAEKQYGLCQSLNNRARD